MAHLPRYGSLATNSHQHQSSRHGPAAISLILVVRPSRDLSVMATLPSISPGHVMLSQVTCQCPDNETQSEKTIRFENQER
jgi:hypothetical protein